MFVSINCSNCGQNLPVPTRIKGRLARCPFCQEVFKVPRILLPVNMFFSYGEERYPTGKHSVVRAVLAASGVAAVIAILLWAVFLVVVGRNEKTAGQDRRFEDANLIEPNERAKALAEAYLKSRHLDISDPIRREENDIGNSERTSYERRKPLDNLADLIEIVEPSVVCINTYGRNHKGTASGFVIDPRGIVVTSYHVLTNVEFAHVVFHDKRTMPVEGYINLAPNKDLALLQIQPTVGELRPLLLAPENPRKGEQVAAFGAPLGLQFSTTQGIVSGIRSPIEMISAGMFLDVQWIQTDAPISVGNSGGPLVNMRGEVVGVNTVTSGGEAQNLNFAISVDAVRQVVKSAMQVSVPLNQCGKVN